jgi:diketogulonate reductase-like aldo/keto reductase
VYETEKEVGEGIQAKVDDGTIKDKSEIFITTKVITNIKKKPIMIVIR